MEMKSEIELLKAKVKELESLYEDASKAGHAIGVKLAEAEAALREREAGMGILKEAAEWGVAAINHYKNALEILSTIKNGKTLFEGSPTNDAECLMAWQNLDSAGKKADLAKERAARAFTVLPAHAKAIAEVVSAAEEHEEIEANATVGESHDCKVCKAVRALKALREGVA